MGNGGTRITSTADPKAGHTLLEGRRPVWLMSASEPVPDRGVPVPAEPRW
jgi:hypothetical protein